MLTECMLKMRQVPEARSFGDLEHLLVGRAEQFLCAPYTDELDEFGISEARRTPEQPA